MKVLRELYKRWTERGSECVTIFNEGGSRSGKTFETFRFLITLANNSSKPLTIYIFRDTLTDCKDYTFKDFKECLKIIYGDDYTNSVTMRGENIRPDVYINKSTLRFRGLDKMGDNEGFPSNIVFVNELLSSVSKQQFEAVTMRCSDMIIADWNPKFTQHWAFDYETRPNTYFTRTTYRDNKHCPVSIKYRIDGYEPTQENIIAGTADKYKWQVYGLGVRCAQEGVIFEDVKWIDAFPTDIEHTILGMDFGYTNDPTAIVRIARKGIDLYIQELCYTPIANPEILAQICKSLMQPNEYFYCDSADKYANNPDGMVYSLLAAGIPVIKAKKYAGSILDGIQMLHSYRLNIVRTKNFIDEQGGYVWDAVNGIPINKPIDKFNHLWDASRYAVMSEFRFYAD